MSGQLTNRNDVDGGARARNRILAVATVAGSQVLAAAAAAQNGTVGTVDTNPILVPEQLIIVAAVAAAGAFAGAFLGCRSTGRSRKKDDE